MTTAFTFSNDRTTYSAEGCIDENAPRQEGEVTLHDNEVFHAVSAMRSGCRYTLIIFFYELQPGADAEEYRATPSLHAAERAATRAAAPA